MTSAREDPRFFRLPRWAQEQIAMLEMRLSERDQHIRIIENETPTRVRYVRNWQNEQAISLSENYPIRYILGKEEWHESIDVTIGKTYITLRGTDSIIVSPEASNTIRVCMDKR